MHRAIAAAAMLFLTANASPVYNYTLDQADSEVTARVAFFGIASKTAGFPRMRGGITLSPAAPERIDLTVTLDARALTAPDKVTLERLRGPNFFDVARYPTITFTGRTMQMTGARDAAIDGMVTARGVTRPARLTVRFDAPPGDATGRSPIGLTATTAIDRRDFGMTAYPLIVGRKVTIRIRARMVPG